MSRWDDEGFWWEDEARSLRGERLRPTPAIPPSNWAPPVDFPNLSAAKIIGVDTETYDPNLMTHGPGWARKDGHLVGVSLSVSPTDSWYFPLRHEQQPELNMDIQAVTSFLHDVLWVDRPVVGANLQYDAGWLLTEDIEIKGIMYDVQYAEALLDDVARSYSLEAISRKYLGTGKVSDELYKWCDLAFGGGATPKQRKNIYRSPVTLVGPYAEADAYQPLMILNKQWPDLHELGLLSLFKMECKLIPVLLGMQLRGVTVDLEKAEKARVQLKDAETTAQEELNSYAGFEVGVNTPDDLQDLCDQKGIVYPRTAKGNPSFVQMWLENHSSPELQLVTEVRKIQKSRVTFIENGIIEKHVDGIIHASYHPLRGEKGGAVSGRYSSSNPNQQQVTSRHPVFAPLIRGLYIPEAGGYTDWCKFDLSQIEYRMFANDSNDEELIQAYQDLSTDFHALVGTYLGGKVVRKIIKNFNFGKLYGMGKDKLVQGVRDNLAAAEIEELFLNAGLTGKDKAESLGLHFIKLYEDQFPAASATLKRFAELAQNTGEIRTILNRRSTFDLWEPSWYGDHMALPYTEAVEVWGTNVIRANTHKGLNRRLQGSAADLMKMGMLDAYEAGLFADDRMGFPHVIVHDEWGFSYHKDLTADFIEFKYHIENAIELKVPVLLDTELGPNWGSVKPVDLTLPF